MKITKILFIKYFRWLKARNCPDYIISWFNHLPNRFIFILAVFLITSCQAFVEKPIREPVRLTPKKIVGPETLPIATVNGVEVSLERFNKLYKGRVSRFRLRGEQVASGIALNIKYAIATQLIDELLIKQAAKQQDVKVTDAEVDEAMQQLVATFPTQEAFQRYLGSLPEGEHGLRERLHLRLLKECLAGVDPHEPVSDEDAQAFYDRNYDRFKIPAHFIVQDILFLVGPDATPDIDNAQKKKAEEVLAMARQPDVSFGTLARRYSEGPTAKVGGYLGRVTEDTVDHRLWTALRAMQADQLSEVLRTVDGYHILKLVRRNPLVFKGFAQAKEKIRGMVRAQNRTTKVAQLLRELRARGIIENFLVRRYMSVDLGSPSEGVKSATGVVFFTQGQSQPE